MATTQTQTRYYLIEREYVGPEQHGPAPRRTIQVTTTPPRTNSSREIRLDGWLGTTYDWAAYARGEYATIEAAEAAARALGPVYEIEDQAEYPDAELVLGLGDHDPRAEWQATDWLAGESLESVGLSRSSTDEEIEAKAEELAEQAAADEQWITDGADAVAELLRQWLAEVDED